ncbi:MAG TPA: phosphatase PAP2 family protein [Thermoanaerobaculia bacterium]|nr:phosphatase PAP2 family protein [Thermoanaerobaculia bacterium]
MARALRPTYLVLTVIEVFLVVQALVVLAVLYRSQGILLGVSASMGVVTLLYLSSGIAFRIVVEKARGRLPDYLQVIRSPEWILTSFRLAVVTALTTYVYGAIKISVPLLHRRIFDEELWALDRWLLFGLSPNVFFLHLFGSDGFLRAIDFLYAKLFGVALVLSLPFLLSLRSNSLRVGFAAGKVALWTLGAWLYLAIPSLGPAYTFHQVWKPVQDLFPTSRLWQYRLIRNYEMVLEIPRGTMNPEINMLYGVAAFPSMHVAFQTYVALWLFRISPRAGVLGSISAVIVFLGSVLTGWHYLIDSVAGVLLAVLCFAISRRVERALVHHEAGGAAVEGDRAP